MVADNQRDGGERPRIKSGATAGGGRRDSRRLSPPARWIDAPQAVLPDEALDVADGDAAPGAGAGLHVGQHVRRQARQHGGALVGARQHRHCFLAVARPGHDERRAPSREKRVQHPALRPFRIADAPPGLELGGDLDGQAGALEDPAGAVLLGGALAQVHAVGLQADIAGHRQPCHRPAVSPAASAPCGAAPRHAPSAAAPTSVLQSLRIPRIRHSCSLVRAGSGFLARPVCVRPRPC